MSRRFYTQALVAPVDGAFRVELDGKPVKTPTGKPLAVGSESLAARIAAEWEAQGPEIDPMTMPLTRLVGVALERADTREQLIADVRAYAATDLLSYRADGPSDFAARQADAYDPVLDWAADHGFALRTTVGIVAIDQDPLSLDRVAAHAGRYDDIPLTLLAHLTATFGSAVLALAVMQGRLEAGDAFDLSQLDDLYRTEVWGDDEDATARAAAIRAEVVAMARLLADVDVPPLDGREQHGRFRIQAG